MKTILRFFVWLFQYFFSHKAEDIEPIIIADPLTPPSIPSPEPHAASKTFHPSRRAVLRGGSFYSTKRRRGVL